MQSAFECLHVTKNVSLFVSLILTSRYTQFYPSTLCGSQCYLHGSPLLVMMLLASGKLVKGNNINSDIRNVSFYVVDNFSWQ